VLDKQATVANWQVKIKIPINLPTGRQALIDRDDK